jgi:REP element-mobilizing transposase RayT
MSRLRRPFLCDRYVFLTVKLLPSGAKLETGDYERLAVSLARMRRKHGFAITAWVFLPDHWHVIIYPPYPLTLSAVFKAVKNRNDAAACASTGCACRARRTRASENRKSRRPKKQVCARYSLPS